MTAYVIFRKYVFRRPNLRFMGDPTLVHFQVTSGSATRTDRRNVQDFLSIALLTGIRERAAALAIA